MAVGLRGLDPTIRPFAEACLKWASLQGVPVTVTSTKRSRAEQAKLYQKFKAGLSRFPANPPGTSAHEYGLAWDSVVPPEYVDWWTSVREAYGWRVPEGDWIHAEVPDWKRLVGLR